MIYFLLVLVVLSATFLYACCKIASLSDEMSNKDEQRRKK